MLTTQQGKRFAYELTMEYIHQNQLLKCTNGEIADRIHKISEISTLICESIENEYHNLPIL